MKRNMILAKVYRLSSLIIMMVMLAVCLVFRWDLATTAAVLFMSLVISAPAVISLNAICWLLRKVEITISFAWILLLAAVPLLVVIPSLLLAGTLPGDPAFLAGLGIFCSYAGLFGYGNAIAQLFKSF